MIYEIMLHSPDQIDEFVHLFSDQFELRETHRFFGGVLVSFSGEIVDEVKNHPYVRNFAPYIPPQPHEITQTLEPNQYGLDRISQINLPMNGEFVYGSTGLGVTIYVIDTGANTSHPDFDGRVLTTPPGSGGDSDTHAGSYIGHGTPAASIALGTVYGVAKGANLVSINAIGPNAPVTPMWAYDWIAQNHPQGTKGVINMSYGGPEYFQPAEEALGVLSSMGLVLVTSAGNDDSTTVTYPARYPIFRSVGISVGSLGGWSVYGNIDLKSPPSNHGPDVDVYAPGIQRAASRHGGSDITAPGTSFAGPLVAGVAACLLGQGVPSSQVKSTIVNNATLGKISGISQNSNNRLLYSNISTEKGVGCSSPTRLNAVTSRQRSIRIGPNSYW